MIAFSFAHFLVGTALRSFTSFILFSFVDYLRRLALSHTLESGAAFHVLLVLNKMCFFPCVCVGGYEWEISHKIFALPFREVLRRVEVVGCFVLTMFAPNFPALGSNNLYCRLFRTGLKFLFSCCCPFWLGSSDQPSASHSEESSAPSFGTTLSILQYHQVPTFFMPSAPDRLLKLL